MPRNPQPIGRLLAFLLVAALIGFTCLPQRLRQDSGSKGATSFGAAQTIAKLAIATQERAGELSRPGQPLKERTDGKAFALVWTPPWRDQRGQAWTACHRRGIPLRPASLVGVVELRI